MLSTSIQILKAIHNRAVGSDWQRGVVCYLLRYKFWKLFTTRGVAAAGVYGLYVIYFDTNFESYSQLPSASVAYTVGCMLSTSIQILKAIHNVHSWRTYWNVVVCYLLRYKFWKLFTTVHTVRGKRAPLYIIYFDTNFESYSQLVDLSNRMTICCILSTSIQILKAIHNVICNAWRQRNAVYYLLRYKFWKLFTTAGAATAGNRGLYIIYFDTNFESYSQQTVQRARAIEGCILSTSIQILKAIHNKLIIRCVSLNAVYYLLRYKFWKLFTTKTNPCQIANKLYIIYFDTNFESYSQRTPVARE